jgi:uncharacterized protein (TIGR02599 family)
MLRRSWFACRLRSGFSLLEILVAMAVFAIVLLAVFSVIDQMRNAWRNARSTTESFQSARLAFEQITRSLSAATLNTYYDYFDAAGRTPRDSGYEGPKRYGRQSDLHFVSGKNLVEGQIGHAVFFQVPQGFSLQAGLQGSRPLLNACGFYVVHDIDRTRPAFLSGSAYQNIPNPRRYRLLHFLQSTENLAIYASNAGNAWFTDPLGDDSPPVEQLAENVLLLAILPRPSAFDSADPLSPDFEYDSRRTSSTGTPLSTEHQLPPVVEVVLVAIDEGAAQRLGDDQATDLSGLFTQSAQFESDLQQLEAALKAKNIRYRVFRAAIAIRGAKWST